MRLLVSCRFAPYSETERLAVRHSATAVEADGEWLESFGPDCWLADGQNAEVQFGHDTHAIGQVVVVAAARDGWWHADLAVESDDPHLLERIRVGTPVSLGARSIRRDSDHLIRTRRHTLAQLQHIAIARPGEHPGYQGAKITSVVESQRTPPSIDWRSSVPPGWEHLLEHGWEPSEGLELLAGGSHNSPATHRFVDGRFVALGSRRLAA